MEFLAILAVFGLVYFGVTLPIFQRISLKVHGRRFVIRLGMAWNFSDPKHRRDVFFSFVSFIVTLGLVLFAVDFFFSFGEARQGSTRVN